LLTDFITFSALRIDTFIIDFSQICVIAAAAVCVIVYTNFELWHYTLLYIYIYIYIYTILSRLDWTGSHLDNILINWNWLYPGSV
jgi:ABC-type xylose transport system permease subunit